LYRTIICVNVNESLLKDLTIEAYEERASKGNMVICNDKGIKNGLREECLSGDKSCLTLHEGRNKYIDSMSPKLS